MAAASLLPKDNQPWKGGIESRFLPCTDSGRDRRVSTGSWPDSKERLCASPGVETRAEPRPWGACARVPPRPARDTHPCTINPHIRSRCLPQSSRRKSTDRTGILVCAHTNSASRITDVPSTSADEPTAAPFLRTKFGSTVAQPTAA
jgi:hypothetical protein